MDRISLTSICLLGGGGHAVVVSEAARLQGLQIAGFFDDRLSGSLMHSVSNWMGTCQAGSSYCEHPKVIAIGNLERRRQFIDGWTGKFATVIHPASVVSAKAIIGGGTFVAACAVVGCNAQIGRHAIINTRAIVEHDCVVEPNVHVGPGAVLGGGVRIGSDTLIGLNASVKPNISIGSNCVIGAGAVVLHDVHSQEVVAGVPARPITRGHSTLRRSA